MNDLLKTFFISLITTLLVQILLGPQLFKYYQANYAASVTPKENSSPSAVLPQQTIPQPEQILRTTPSNVQPPAIQAPDFRGLPISKAQPLAQSLDITLIEDSQQVAPQKQAGEILQQTPAPGSLLTDRILRVVVAHTPTEIIMPTVTHKSAEDARTLLEQAGFRNIKMREKPSSKTPGTILSQTPQAEKRVSADTEIILEIAALPTVEVPKVTGKYLAQAKAAIEHAGLKVGNVTYREHEEHGQNFVLQQEPEEGSKVSFGTKVNIVVVAPN